MEQFIVNEANRLKQQAGQELDALITFKFRELVEEKILKGFSGKQNFSHTGFTYKFQYKTNYVLQTLDDKLIIINSSNSYRDRVKQDLYDFQGIMKHADISNDIIAAILLYPDEEFSRNSSLRTFRENVQNKVAYCPATHILSFSELLQFLENHKVTVEQEIENEKEENETTRDGSYYGLKGNAFEKEVVNLLNTFDQLGYFKSDSQIVEPLYLDILSRLSFDYNLDRQELISVEATNTVKKLARGGNAKTDVIIKINTSKGLYLATISIKTTTQSRVSCHDYRAEDFIRVLNVSGQKLEDYLNYYQQFGSHKSFVAGLPSGYSAEEFEELLKPHKKVLIEWALTGAHDLQNLIEPENQISQYLLINKPERTKFIDFKSYIDEISENSKSVYGLPLGWTHPSKQCGSRIQFKLPILI